MEIYPNHVTCIAKFQRTGQEAQVWHRADKRYAVMLVATDSDVVSISTIRIFETQPPAESYAQSLVAS